MGTHIGSTSRWFEIGQSWLADNPLNDKVINSLLLLLCCCYCCNVVLLL